MPQHGPPDSLTSKIELFREAGLFMREEDELFLDDSWGQVMIGQGIDADTAGRRSPTMCPARTSAPFLETLAKSYRSRRPSAADARPFRRAMVGGEVKERHHEVHACRRLPPSHSRVACQAAPAADYRARLPEDEVIYFVLPDRFENGDPSNDRGGLQGDRLTTGFDPTSKGFFHGGDLKGLTARLDYIQGLGATAVWLAPVFKNKPVQGAPGQESAGYHGYWITDFTQRRSASRRRTQIQGVRRCGARARHEGLSSTSSPTTRPT